MNKDLHGTANSENIKFTAKHGLRGAFKKGNNSSTLRYHCRLHFEIYQKRCTTAGVAMHHRAIPPDVMTHMDREKAKGGVQSTLDSRMFKIVRPQEFTKADILHSVAMFIVCENQVSLHEVRWALS